MIPFNLNISGTLHTFSKAVVMGILNVTPDSFYDGGKHGNVQAQLKQSEKMLHEGAGIIDIGAASSRPGTKETSEEEELNRLLPAVKAISAHFPMAVISVDTYRSNVARLAVEAGAHIVNDISAGRFDSEMIATLAALRVPYIAMHMQGEPGTMQENPVYNNVVTDVYAELHQKIEQLHKAGVHDVIADVGFGFGKTVEHNYALLKNLNHFAGLNVPLLVGLSRKSMITKVLNCKATEALNGSSVLHAIALINNASILRVHDVREAVEAVSIYTKYIAT